jgi:hypothetical protein
MAACSRFNPVARIQLTVPPSAALAVLNDL